MKHITFDFETLGNGPTAPIIQIGATKFTEEEVLDTFRVNVKWESLQKYPFKMDYSTIHWWLQQDKEAQQSITQTDGQLPIKKALKEFEKWIGNPRDYQFWSHATFDAPILTNACKTVGIDVIIPYHNQRDIRTLTYLTGNVEVKRKGVAHDAGDDSIYQAEYIRTMLNKLATSNLEKLWVVVDPETENKIVGASPYNARAINIGKRHLKSYPDAELKIGQIIIE